MLHSTHKFRDFFTDSLNKIKPSLPDKKERNDAYLVPISIDNDTADYFTPFLCSSSDILNPKPFRKFENKKKNVTIESIFGDLFLKDGVAPPKTLKISEPKQFQHFLHVGSDSIAQLKSSSSEEELNYWWSRIYPKLDKLSQKKSKPWRKGVPWEIRWVIWKAHIGNQLNITSELFDIISARAANDQPTGCYLGQESSVTLIATDLPRTICQNLNLSNETTDTISKVLRSYAFYRPDVGYIQGMSYLVAILTHACTTDNKEQRVFEIFSALCNLLNGPVLRIFYSMNMSKSRVLIERFEKMFETCEPQLFEHFQQIGIQPELYLYEWVLTCYAQTLPLDLVLKIWDRIIIEGQHVIFQVALSILASLKSTISTGDFDEWAHVLTHGIGSISSKINLDLFSETLDQAFAFQISD